MKKGIKEVLQTEMLAYTAPVIINNLPSIDGLLVSQKQVIYAMNKAHMNSNGAFYKMLKATGRIFDYYVLGDAPLEGVMKNMANNYVLNKYLMPKGSFGNKNLKDGIGSAPRYIECKLDPYGEFMLEGINKNAVEMKWNYDATEKEPIMLPSKIPNILTNLRMSISVSEANKMPSHNLIDSCNAIQSYIRNKDIDKAIEILKAPDLPSGGGIIYDKKTFDTIYKTGKGSFINIGKCVYDKNSNTLTITEIPYMTYIENINDEIEKNFDKFKNEVDDFHNGTDREGLKLELYLKKGANIDIVIQKLRKYTSYESKFACNFTILDLNGKLPVLCSLEDLISKWLTHRVNCIKNEINFDLEKYKQRLHLLNGLKNILSYLDEVIRTIRGSKKDAEAINKIIEMYSLDEKQAEYIVGIKLINLTEEYINNRLKDIVDLQEKVERLEYTLNSEDEINNIIIEQLEEVKSKFGKERLTELVEDEKTIDIAKENLIEQYNCRIYYTNHYIKKHLKQSDNHKYKDSDVVLGDITTTNKSALLIFTNQGNRYKLPVHELSTYTPSQLGDYIYNVTAMSKDEEIIKIVSVDKEIGNMIFVYDNGKIAKVPITSFMSNYTKLQKCYNPNAKLLDCYYTEKDIDVALFSSEGKGLIVNTSNINPKSSRSTQGVTAQKLSEGTNCVGCIIDVQKEDRVLIKTEKNKEKEFLFDDIALTGKPNEERTLFGYIYGKTGNQGNMIWNMRNSEDTIISAQIIKE